MSQSQEHSSCDGSRQGGFPDTLWSMVSEAGKGTSAQSAEALRHLCAIYREPILNWLRRNYNPTQAEDLTHGFIEHLLEKNRLEHFARGNAKFRSFLLKCLKRFLRGEWRKDTADKRGGGWEPVSVEEHEVGASAELDRELDRDFAVTVHRQTLLRLREKFDRAGQGVRFEMLRQFILGDDPSLTYGEVAERLHLKTNAVKKAVFDLRDAYYEAFRQQVAQTTNGESVEEEMRYLVTLLADADIAEHA